MYVLNHWTMMDSGHWKVFTVANLQTTYKNHRRARDQSQRKVQSQITAEVSCELLSPIGCYCLSHIIISIILTFNNG